MTLPNHFVDSICDGFTIAMNRRGGDFCNQDGYEALSAVFGRNFSQADLRGASAEQIERLVCEVRDTLDLEGTSIVSVRQMLDDALYQWSGAR